MNSDSEKPCLQYYLFNSVISVKKLIQKGYKLRADSQDFQHIFLRFVNNNNKHVKMFKFVALSALLVASAYAHFDYAKCGSGVGQCFGVPEGCIDSAVS